MPGRDRLARMDIDTGWAYDDKVRRLQAQEPDRWPIYWAAYLALLGEVWAKGRAGRRLTLEDAWCPALRCSPAEAKAALVRAGITDKAGRVPAASWARWVEPVLQVFEAKRAGAALGAERRWGNATPTGSGNASGNGSRNAPARPARPPARPARAHAREDGGPTKMSDLLDHMPWMGKEHR